MKNKQYWLTGTPMYPRDLNSDLKQDFLNDLKKYRPDLIEAYENGRDIAIAEVSHLRPEDWFV